MLDFDEVEQSIRELLGLVRRELDVQARRHAEQLEELRLRHATELAATVARFEGALDESRRVIATLTADLLTTKMALERPPAPPDHPTYGVARCACGRMFHRVQKRQRTCAECKSYLGQVLAAKRYGRPIPERPPFKENPGV